MKFSEKQLQTLLEALVLTKNEKVSCDGCLQHMAEFAEKTLAGKTIPERLRCIDEHLQQCGECREEFEALKIALA